jgi:hypothetical protein
MVPRIQSDDACESSHEQKVPQSHETGKRPVCPRFSRDNTDWIKLHIEREALTYALGMPAGYKIATLNDPQVIKAEELIPQALSLCNDAKKIVAERQAAEQSPRP